MVEIDRGYVLAAQVLAVAGMLLGFYMGVAADNKLQTVHVAMVLPGFVTLAIYGIVFKLWPGFKAALLAAVQFWTGTIGAVAMVIGSHLFVTAGSVPLVAVGSLLAIVAVALLTWPFWSYAK
jgi:hypothetical protein